MRHGPHSVGMQQWGKSDNGGKPNPTIAHELMKLYKPTSKDSGESYADEL